MYYVIRWEGETMSICKWIFTEVNYTVTAAHDYPSLEMVIVSNSNHNL